MIFSRKQPKGSEAGSLQATINARKLYPVLTAEQLLSHPKRQSLLKKIKILTGLDESDYEQLYNDLITRFANFVQLIPSSPGGKLFGLLDDGLQRALIALQLCKEPDTENDDPLYNYGIFTAALLLDIGKIITQQKVMISDATGTFIDEWQPLQGTLVGLANYYKMRLLGGQWITLSHYITPLLARQLMPEVGFLWLNEDYAILQMWIAALIEDEANGGSFMLLLALIKKRFAELKGSLPVPALTITEPKETEIGEDFLVWLIEGLNNGTIPYNEPDANVHFLKDGILLADPIFEDFSRAYSKCRDWVVVQAKFNLLGLTKLSGDDRKFEQYFSTKNLDLVRHPKTQPLTRFLSKAKQQTASGPAVSKSAQHKMNKLQSYKNSNKPINSLKQQGLLIRNSNLVYFGEKPPPTNEQLIQLHGQEQKSHKLLDKIMHKLALKAAIKSFHNPS